MSLRLPSGLRERLDAAAAERGVSPNAYCVSVLSSSVGLEEGAVRETPRDSGSYAATPVSAAPSSSPRPEPILLSQRREVQTDFKAPAEKKKRR